MSRAEAVLLRAGWLLRREPWWAEFWAAVAALGWAACSALVEAERPAFRILNELADERFWAISGALLGVGQVAVLLVDSRAWRRGMCFLASWWWMMLLLALWLARPTTPSLALYANMAAINLFSLLRLRREEP